MKIKMYLIKKLLRKEKILTLSDNYLYLFIEKLFFILSDLLNFHLLCKIYLLKSIFFKEKVFKLLFKNYYLMNIDIFNFSLNRNDIFLLIEYSRKVKGVFFLNKKILINKQINKYIFFKIILFYLNARFFSLEYILFFISMNQVIKNKLQIYYLKNFTFCFKFLFYIYEYIKSNS